MSHDYGHVSEVSGGEWQDPNWVWAPPETQNQAGWAVPAAPEAQYQYGPGPPEAAPQFEIAEEVPTTYQNYSGNA